MKVSDLLVKMEGMSTALASFAKATNDAERTKASNDLLSLSSDIKEMASKGSIEAEYASRIEADIKLGKLVTKEVADKAVEEAKKAAEDKFNAELAESKIRQDRIAKLAENDIDPATEYNDILSADGKTPMTIAIHLAEIGVDAKGEREFQMQLNLWKAVAEKNKVTPAAESVAAAAAAGVTSASAANTGKVSTGKKTILSAVGGTNDHADQVPADIASQPKRLQGKYSFSK